MGMTSVIIDLYVAFFACDDGPKFGYTWGNSDISPPTFWISYMPSSFECKQFGYINGISVLYNMYMYNLKIWNFPKRFLLFIHVKFVKVHELINARNLRIILTVQYLRIQCIFVPLSIRFSQTRIFIFENERKLIS